VEVSDHQTLSWVSHWEREEEYHEHVAREKRCRAAERRLMDAMYRIPEPHFLQTWVEMMRGIDDDRFGVLCLIGFYSRLLRNM
jgi:hypothetical protein